MKNLKRYYHFFRAILANLVYFFPARKLVLVGVTGTDGKTTTSQMVYHILKKNGVRVGLITTTSVDVGKGMGGNYMHSTTPDVFRLQKFLREGVNNGLTHMVLEVSSHGLDQNRLWGCCFEVSVITNLSREHLDYHQNMNDYLKTKARLFLVSKKKVFNKDDGSFTYLLSQFPDCMTYSLVSEADINLNKMGLGLKFKEKFNRYNALASIAVCGELGVSVYESVAALADFSRPPGRQEIIQEKPFIVMNDFAHTPNALKQLFVSLKPYHGRLIHVFGCPGRRDRGKRPLMGKIAADYARVIILTAEDPRDEPIERINGEICSGVPKSFLGEIIMIENRAEAIKRAISLAKKGDVVLCTGKGAERTQELSTKTINWNESEIIMKYLEKK